ncbi:uncharacterized protein O3C94_013272 [Discoglossus pictus]
MDPEGWKMSNPRDNLLKYRKDMTRCNDWQVSHGRYVNMERLGKRTTHGMMTEDSRKLEGRLLQAKIKTEYVEDLTSGEQYQYEMGKTHSEESSMKSVNKYSVKKFASLIPDSTNHIENLTFTKYGQDSKITTKPVFGISTKKLPIQVRDVGRTFIQQRNKTYAQLSRDDIKLNPSNYADTKEPSPVFCQRAKIQGSRKSSASETMLQGADHCDKSSFYLGIPFHHPHKRIMIQNNSPSQSRTSETWQRMKATGQESPMHTIDRVNQKIYDKHRFSYKDVASQSSSFAHKQSSSTVAFRTGINKPLNLNAQKSFRSPVHSPNKVKTEVTTVNQKEKPAGNSTYRRFLLIDSQGLPYTVVVEDSKSTKINNVTKESNSDSTVIGTTRSLAPRKVYTCPVCFRIFEYLSYLQRHSIAHSQQKPHICKICGKAFKRTSHLTRHKYTHFGGKPCQCQICHRRFRDAGELTRHQQIHTGERPHQCDICHMRFGERSTLQRHMLCKHVK